MSIVIHHQNVPFSPFDLNLRSAFWNSSSASTIMRKWDLKLGAPRETGRKRIQCAMLSRDAQMDSSQMFAVIWA